MMNPMFFGLLNTFDPVGVPLTFSERLPLGAEIANDAQAVWDGSQWVLYYGTTAGGGIYRRTCATLGGTWSAETLVNASYQKPYVLVDGDGLPVLLGGVYTMYAIRNIAGTQYVIRRLTAASLTGSWTDQGDALSYNTALTLQPDGYGMQTVSALYDSSTVYLFYMGNPGTNGVAGSDATYGFASRGCYATASDPAGTFTRQGVILNPSTNSGDWDYGLIGGMQILRRPSGGWMGTYNACDTRPSNSGLEPNTSLFGMFTAQSPAGTWTKSGLNPYGALTNIATGAPESTNLWRVYLVKERGASQYYWWFNSGPFGAESLSYANSPALAAYWNNLFSDSFARANGAIGNSWTDAGSKFLISSNQLAAAPTGAGTWMLLRPLSEATLNQVVKLTIASVQTGVVYVAAVRVVDSTAATPTCYDAEISRFAPTTMTVNKVVAGTKTALMTITIPSLVVGHSYRLELGVRSSSPTLVSVSLYDLTAGTTIVSNQQARDSTASLQVVNPSGIAAYVDPTRSFVATLVEVQGAS